MNGPLRLGISTCPNDTFAFHAILERRIDLAGLELEVELLDVEELNERLLAGDFDVAKGSFALALAHAEDLWVLDAGAALGWGVGPVLLAPPGRARPPAEARVLAPGAHTTATLLYRLFHPREGRLEQVLFSRILPALERGEADLGVCIHEGRFTYADRGLELREDLGTTWEQRTRTPLPLGGIFARRALGPELAARVSDAIRRSIDHAIAHADEALPTMRAHADEHADDVLRAHVDLYVNAWTRSLGEEGRAALDALARLAREAGLLAAQAARLEVVGAPDERTAELLARRLFHVVPAAAWRAEPEALWRPASLAAQGFVHLSFADQLAGTLERHFPASGEHLLLEVDRRAVADRVVFEASRGGALFPHLYRPLRRAEVVRTWPLERRGDTWDPPRLGANPAEDEPAGWSPVAGG